MLIARGFCFLQTNPLGGPGLISYTYFSQAIVQIDTQQVVRHELLLRTWDAKLNEWRLPDNFEITVKMQIKLLKRALKRLTVKNVNINLTPTQFADENTCKQLVDFVANEPELQQLTVELTAAPTLEQVKTIGAEYHAGNIKIAIDDVGSDIDNYPLVEQLIPYVDGMKFALQNMRAQGRMDGLEANIAKWSNLAQAHHTSLTFEGIESFADLQLAKKFDVDQAQGFYFSRPAEPAR